MRANLTRLSWLNGAHMFLVFMPIAVPYYRAHGLGMHDVYLLQSTFSVATMLFEVPSGHLADRIGRRRALILGGWLWGGAFLFLLSAGSFAAFACFEVIAAAGVACFSGADLALLYASLEELPDGTARGVGAIGRLVSSAQLGETLAALLGGALATISLYAPLEMQAAVAWLPLVIALGLYEPARTGLAGRRHRDDLRTVWRALFRSGRFTGWLAMTSVVYGMVTIVAVFSFQAQWAERGVALGHFGWLWAAQNLLVAVGARVAHRVVDRFGFVVVVTAVAVLPIVGFFGMSSLPGQLAIAAGACFPLCRALNQVVLRDALNVRMPTELRATANSVLALGMRALFALAGPLFGSALDATGSRAFGAASLFACVAALALALPLAASARRERG